MRVKPLFAWYDLWIGLFWDKKTGWLYFLPLPMIGLVFKFTPPGYRIFKDTPSFYRITQGFLHAVLEASSERDAYTKAWSSYRGYKNQSYQ